MQCETFSKQELESVTSVMDVATTVMEYDSLKHKD